MITANQLSKVECNVCNFIAQQPSKAQEGRWVTDNFLSLAHSSIPVGLLNDFGCVLGFVVVR